MFAKGPAVIGEVEIVIPFHLDLIGKKKKKA